MPGKKKIYTKWVQMRFKPETIAYAQEHTDSYLSTELRRLTELGVAQDKKMRKSKNNNGG